MKVITPSNEIPAFAELLAMQFGIYESTKVANLIAENRLWVICIKMKQLQYDDTFGNCTDLEIEPDLRRFGIGLFNRTHTYGNQTDKARAVRDIFYNDDLFCFVVKGPHLDDIINEFRVSMDNTPKFPFAGFLGNHFDKPSVQYGDYTPKEERPKIRPETNIAFRNDNYYTVFLVYAAIAEHESEMVGCERGNYFDAYIKVAPISEQEKNKFIGFLELPINIARLKVNSFISLRFQEEATVKREPRVADAYVVPKRHVSTPENMDVWLGRVIDPLPAAPDDTTSVIIYRPYNESPNARQPSLILADNTENDRDIIREAWNQKVQCKIPANEKQFKQLLGCIRDFQAKCNKEVHDPLMGGDSMNIPRYDFWEDIDPALVDLAKRNDRIYADAGQIFTNLGHMPGRLFVVTGAAGTGKSHVLSLLSIIQAKRGNFEYPVHPKDFDGNWLPKFTSYVKSTVGENETPQKKMVKGQSVIVCPTNASADNTAEKLDRLATQLLPDEPMMIIRVHSLESEFSIAERRYTIPQRTYPVTGPISQPERESTESQADDRDEDFAFNAVIAYLDSVKSHFERTEPKTKSPIDGLQDHRVKTLKYSLGTRMLQVAGLVEGPFKSEEKFPAFNLLYRNRLDAGGRLEEDEERDFKSDCKRLMRLVIGMADIIVSCPSTIAQPTLYHSLHPSFVAFEEATMMKETDILPILVYLFPIAFGFFGDPKQLGPTIMSTTKENPFRSQLAVSLLDRLITAGYEIGKLIVQRRLAGDIHDLVTTVFHRETLRWDFEHKIDPTGVVNRVKTFNKRNFHIDSNVAFLNSERGQQSRRGTSYLNDANVRDALDLANDIHNAMGAALESIVILTGYEGQYRAYLQEVDRRSNSSQIPWLDLNIQKIETFQGSECDFVIFDGVRTKGLGFMANFRRWHVALSRARFGLWVVYSDAVLRTDPLAKSSKYIQGMREFASSKQLKVTLKKPEYESFPDIPQGKSVTSSGVNAHNKLRAAAARRADRHAARRAPNVTEASATGEASDW